MKYVFGMYIILCFNFLEIIFFKFILLWEI